MLDRRGQHLPIACAGVSPRRPLVFWGLIACNLVIWIAMAAMIIRMLGR